MCRGPHCAVDLLVPFSSRYYRCLFAPHLHLVSLQPGANILGDFYVARAITEKAWIARSGDCHDDRPAPVPASGRRSRPPGAAAPRPRPGLSVASSGDGADQGGQAEAARRHDDDPVRDAAGRPDHRGRAAGSEASGWQGIGAPKGTPAAIIDALNASVNAALAEPKFAARLADLGIAPFPGSPAEIGKFIVDYTEKWAKVIRAAGIKLE